MTYFAAILIVSCFAAALRILRVAPVAADVLETARGAARSMHDPALSEAAKETAARKASLALMGRFVSITLRAAIAVVVPLVVLALLDTSGLARRTAVIDLLTTWRGLILASAVTILIYTVRARH